MKQSFRLPAVTLVLLLTILGTVWGQRTAGSAVSRADYLINAPLPFRDWKIIRQELTDSERKLLMPDAVLLRRYVSAEGEEADLAVLAGHRKQTVHTPAFCMAGGGWNTLSQSNVEQSVGNEMVPAVRSVMDVNGHLLLVTYFFTDGTHSLRSLPQFQMEQMLGRLKGQTQIGALVRVMVPVVTDKARAEKLTDEFASAVLPGLLQHLRDAR